MFGRKTGSIGEVLEEGRSWVTSLETAIEKTEEVVSEVNDEIFNLETKRTILDESITEGKTVTQNFKNMLGMNKK